MRVEVKMKLGDIETSTPCKCYDCPVSWATLRALRPKYYAVCADYEMIVALGRKGSPIIEAKTPETVKTFMQAFDSGQPAEPITFGLDFEARA